MHVVIRDLKEEELPFVEEFTVETGWKWDVPDSYKRSLDKKEWSKRLLELFRKLSRRENHRIFVAEDDNHAFLGYVWVGEGNDMITGKSHGFVYDLFVREEFRGKGIAKMLLEKAETYCRKKGYSRILLMVAAKNQSAIQLYTRVGFETEQMYMGKDL